MYRYNLPAKHIHCIQRGLCQVMVKGCVTEKCAEEASMISSCGKKKTRMT